MYIKILISLHSRQLVIMFLMTFILAGGNNISCGFDFLITSNVEHLFMRLLAYGRNPGEESGQVFEKRQFREVLQQSEWSCLPHATFLPYGCHCRKC